MNRYGWLFPSAEAALADALDATWDAAESNHVTPLPEVEAAAAEA